VLRAGETASQSAALPAALAADPPAQPEQAVNARPARK